MLRTAAVRERDRSEDVARLGRVHLDQSAEFATFSSVQCDPTGLIDDAEGARDGELHSEIGHGAIGAIDDGDLHDLHVTLGTKSNDIEVLHVDDALAIDRIGVASELMDAIQLLVVRHFLIELYTEERFVSQPVAFSTAVLSSISIMIPSDDLSRSCLNTITSSTAL